MDLTDIKSWIVFKFNQWTDDFCYFNDAKCCWNISINVSMQSIIRAVWINANFLKSCQLLLYLEICIVQEFLARIKRWVDFIILSSRKVSVTWEKLEDYWKISLQVILCLFVFRFTSYKFVTHTLTIIALGDIALSYPHNYLFIT